MHASAASAAALIPRPRTPAPEGYEAARVRTADPGAPEFAVGVCFDALRLPAAAGGPLLARTAHAGPALQAGADVWLLIDRGAAEEVPELLRWLEWGALPGALGLTALGAGARIPAPAPAGVRLREAGVRPREAAVWLRPPPPGSERGRGLPALLIGALPPGTPDLVRLVDAAATECHRALLRRQPLAFS